MPKSRCFIVSIGVIKTRIRPAVTRYYWSKLCLSSDSLLSGVTMASAIIRIRFSRSSLSYSLLRPRSHSLPTTGGFKRETFAPELGHVESPKIKRVRPLALAALIAPLISDFDVQGWANRWIIRPSEPRVLSTVYSLRCFVSGARQRRISSLNSWTRISIVGHARYITLFIIKRFTC